MTYWDKQTRWDVAAAIFATIVIWSAPKLGIPAVFEVAGAKEVARSWLSPILTLLGMMSATTAFIFTVIDRPEFKIIRGAHAESQLWRIFAQNIGWLAVAGTYCAVLTFLSEEYLRFALPVGTWLLVLMVICVAKFAWVVRQVIFVRIDQTRQP